MNTYIYFQVKVNTECEDFQGRKSSISVEQDIPVKVPSVCLLKIPQSPKIENGEVKKIRSSKPYNPGSVLRKKLSINSVSKCMSESSDSRTYSVQTSEAIDSRPKTDVRYGYLYRFFKNLPVWYTTRFFGNWCFVIEQRFKLIFLFLLQAQELADP